MTLNLLRFLHRLLIDNRTLEPRRGFFFFFYYVTGLWVVFIVLSMVMLALDLYNFPFFRDFVYGQVGEGILTSIEKILF
jgi:hypothetical protein